MTTQPARAARYYVGLDLGQANDPSALAVLEQTPTLVQGFCPSYACRHLQRWPLGTAYTAIVADLSQLLLLPPLPGSTLVVDATGCGRPVVEMMRQAQLPVCLVPVMITAGHALTAGADGYYVPKRELVSMLQVLLQSRRLQVARALAETATLERELLGFQTRITPARHETFAGRSNVHDDLVLAVALAGWAGETLGRHKQERAEREVVLWPKVRNQAAAGHGPHDHVGLQIHDLDGDVITFNGQRIDLRDEPNWWEPR
jgi:hypothetical protein